MNPDARRLTMHRALRLLPGLFCVSLLLALGSAGAATRSTAVAIGTAHQAPAATARAADNGDTLVYITKTGKKYHADGCRSLSKSRIPITLRDAVTRGYTPCSLCKPPALRTGQEAAAATATVPSAQAAARETVKDNGDTTVYITRTGAKYHRAGCRSLSRSSIPIKLRDAVAKGYGACKLCNPPVLTKR
jgi:methylphosphotriester-DNA--protein-cysteine methyltransferase